MKPLKLEGTITALVTPFKNNYEVDFDALDRVVELQLKSGINGIVVLGSTGEAATLSEKEKLDVILAVQKKVNGKIPVIVGVGSNNTKATIENAKNAAKYNFDAVLIVCPFYNKPTQEGLFQHFNAISEAVDIPQIIYNVPGRTGTNISAETQIRIASECKNVIATKEASGNLEQMMQIIKYSPKDFTLLCGDDALAVPCICAGGRGIISVLSNYAPKMFTQCINFALNGQYKEAMKIHYELFEFMKVNFIESNPIPVKAFMSELGLIQNVLRMPLLPISDKNKKLIQELVNNNKIN
ncbi:MAG: 4-hydroxy-tetrahydrodipicolinate synthase [Bacteroidetes bacterium]|nr:4-hydroxy-tetrahydrodipicolinate synthase [Bacteroidota bacterium]